MRMPEYNHKHLYLGNSFCNFSSKKLAIANIMEKMKSQLFGLMEEPPSLSSKAYDTNEIGLCCKPSPFHENFLMVQASHN